MLLTASRRNVEWARSPLRGWTENVVREAEDGRKRRKHRQICCRVSAEGVLGLGKSVVEGVCFLFSDYRCASWIYVDTGTSDGITTGGAIYGSRHLVAWRVGSMDLFLGIVTYTRNDGKNNPEPRSGTISKYGVAKLLFQMEVGSVDVYRWWHFGGFDVCNCYSDPPEEVLRID